MKRMIAFIFCFFLMVSTVNAASYYVSFTAGADSNNGTSTGTPWQYSPWQPSAGGNSDSTTLQPDDFVYFKRGDTWTEQEIIVEDSGTDGHPITLDAYGEGVDPIFDGNNDSGNYYGQFQLFDKSWITIKNLEFRYNGYETANITADTGEVQGIVVDGCTFDYNYSDNNDGYMCLVVRNGQADSTHTANGVHNIIIQNSTFKNTGHNGIRFWNRDSTSFIYDVIVRNNTFYNCDHHGIDFWRNSGATYCYNFTITKNTFQECQGAMYLPNLHDSEISFNLIYDDNTTESTDTFGIKFDQLNGTETTNVVFVGNIIYDYTAAGAKAIWVTYTDGVDLYNNTVYGNTQACYVAFDPANFTNTNNLFYANTSGGNCSNYGSLPLLTNPGGGDFTLQSGSPLIGAGSDLGNGLQYGLDPTSSWPDNVKPVNQDDYEDWEIGAFVYIEAAELGGPGTITGGGSGSIAGGGSGSIIGTTP